MLTILNISSEEADRLNYERYHYPCPIVQKRLHAVYIKAVIGLSNEKVGDIVGADRNSIHDWVAICHHKGIDGLTQVNYGNKYQHP